jgi:hypothetical protein
MVTKLEIEGLVFFVLELKLLRGVKELKILLNLQEISGIKQ